MIDLKLQDICLYITGDEDREKTYEAERTGKVI